MSDDSDTSAAGKPERPSLSAAARRCLGVLVEKAKTTPDNYPLSLAAVITGANQKSNRAPQMELDEGAAMLALDELREIGAAREIQGGGRVNKYRHAAYEFFDVDSPGAAILTELLLRGPQTVGELRTRASRMHAFADLQAVQQELDQLAEKNWVEPLSPAGRGQLFSHTLYTPQERQYLLPKLEKTSAAVEATGTTASAQDDRLQRIQSRLDEVTGRLEVLEAKLADLES